MITTIRPSQLFRLVKEEGPRRVAQVVIPKRRNEDGPDHSASLLDIMILIALMKITQARKVFEIGTCLGNTTTNLALNAGPDTTIYTLDLDPQSAESIEQTDDDRAATRHRFSHPQEWLRFDPSLRQDRIRPLFGDSTQFNYIPFAGEIDLVWIDGGHTRATVESDTRAAHLMRRRDSLACIAWHDYGNPVTKEVTEFLQSERDDLYHVEDSLIVLSFNRPFPK